MLVIGYGNQLRGDDGLGVRAAEAVAAWGLPDVEVHAVHQLTPELAEPVASARQVIFVDARPAAETGGVWVQRLAPATASPGLGHTSDPHLVLALAQTLYGRCPPVRLVTIPAGSFAAGDQLSPTAAHGLLEALGVLTRLLRDGFSA
jgi:hydrogenase maturation protease